MRALFRNCIIVVGFFSLMVISAYADPFHAGTFSFDRVLPPNETYPPGTFSFNGVQPGNTIFSDGFSFTLTGSALFNASVISIELQGWGMQWLSLEVTQGISIVAGPVSASYYPSGGFFFATLSGTLSAGTYDVVISGQTLALGGSYGGNVNFVTNKVAEPNSLLLLGIGFSVLGLFYYRKKKE